MEKFFKRSAALVIALIFCIGVFNYTAVQTQAATVDYVYAGKYIKNWGVREEVATFLSPNAEKFYDDNDTSLKELMSLDGSSTISSVPTSELYKKLKSLMVSNHTYVTSYNDTRPLFQYTDCQNSGKTSSAISSFYSGKDIGPAWDSGKTWNREHVWPNSKGDLAGNGENDIMMLRPTATSENGSRGNKAYGTGVSYYNPNGESGGKYDLRGDVSRIILYQYVRWGCTNTGSKYNSKDIFGTSGVIESKEILLLWMEEDPVDTWELGRNDSVESITGTRNVFVDYPELAFILFGEEVPAGYQSPSGSMEGTEPVITATANNASWGTVSVNGNVITATPNAGYTAFGYTIVSGNATVSRDGNAFTVETNADVTIRINFAPLEDDDVSTPETSTPETSEPEVSEPEVSEPETSEPETSTPETSTPEVSDTEESTPEESTPEESTPEESGADESKDVSAEANGSDAEGGNSTDSSVSDESENDKTDETESPWAIVVIVILVIAAIVIVVIIVISKKEDKKADVNRKKK